MDSINWNMVKRIGKELIDHWHNKRMEQIRYEKATKALRGD